MNGYSYPPLRGGGFSLEVLEVMTYLYLIFLPPSSPLSPSYSATPWDTS